MILRLNNDINMINLKWFASRLNNWMFERNLTIETQKQGFMRNIFEEYGELALAIKNKNDNDFIDAILDITVFAFNLNIDIVNSDIQIERIMIDKDFVINHPLEFIHKQIHNIINYDTRPCLDLSYKHLLAGVCVIIEHKGYDLVHTFIELLTALDSRKGTYDNELKKFVKDTSRLTYLPQYKKIK